MQISTAPTTVPVSSRLSPVEVWQILLKHLLAMKALSVNISMLVSHSATQ